jgi:hypothetical protein
MKRIERKEKCHSRPGSMIGISLSRSSSFLYSKSILKVWDSEMEMQG